MTLRGLWRRLQAGVRAFRMPPAAEPYAEAMPLDVAAICARVAPYTMTSRDRVWALVEAVRYVARARVPGAFAECGVWRGGSAFAMVLTLQQLAIDDRDIYLFDTFEGMPEPGTQDTSRYGEDAPATWRRSQTEGTQPWADYFSPEMFNVEDVHRLMVSTGYPPGRIHVVKGPVEATLPAAAPAALALLRLDTDWYASTRHELETLYPRLAGGGVLVIDDYGHWDGCRRAVDEYFGSVADPVLLQRIDYTGRLAIKVPSGLRAR